MSTTSNALPGRNKVETNDIRNGAVTTPKIRSRAVTAPKLRDGAVNRWKIQNGAVTPAKLQDHPMWALVTANGTLIQGSGVDAVRKGAAGIYQVRFDRRITTRAVTATIYSDGAGSGQVNVKHCDPAHPLGGCALDPAFDNARTAFVNTEASDGANADRIFLVVAEALVPGTTMTRGDLGGARGEAAD